MIDPKAIVSGRLKELSTAPRWFKNSFSAQTAFIRDPAPLKAAQCTRRAGKSYGAGLYLCKEAYENPGVSVLYVALTRDSAERIMWKDVLKAIDREFGLGAHFKDQNLTMTLPNGSQIMLTGADSRADDMDKFLGQKFKLAIIDEAAKYRIDVHRMIFDVLKPAISDYAGTIAMIGTACNFVESYFARVTQHKEHGWSVHKWSAADNPHMVKTFTAEMKQLRDMNPEVDKEAWFIQNYLGQWVVDTSSRVYAYSPDNMAKKLPDLPFTYNMGITLSFRGESAVSVVGYSRKCREAYVVHTEKIPSSDLYAVMEVAMNLQRLYDCAYIAVVDSSQRLATEIRARFPISVQDVSEKDKPALIKLFNAELGQNNIKVLQNCTDIVREWETIIRDDRGSNQVLKEHPSCPNQVATAALYAWQFCYNYGYQPEIIREDPNDKFWDKMSDKLKESPTIHEDEENIWFGSTN